MTDAKLDKLYKPDNNHKFIGHFRVRIGTYNQDTSFPIDLTQSDFNLLYELRRYFEQQGTDMWINIEEEK